jgi:5,10-methylenetetrahydromethanopterin reductase
MDLSISCAFATSPTTPDDIALAEHLGYDRAWCYDSPAIYPDVWMTLALAADRTDRIGLGPAVLVPNLRHPMTNAAAIATLVGLAPGRVAVAIGSGFTGRFTLGQRPLRWADVQAYVEVVRALLRGEAVEWEGALIQMLHPESHAPARPIDVPIFIGAEGPKGTAVAHAVGDGIFSAVFPNADGRGQPQALLRFGTVLDPGELHTDVRVIEAAGAAVAVIYHGMYERDHASVDSLPGGAVWHEAIDATPERERHLAIHEGHLIGPTERDRAALDAGGAELIPTFTLSGTAAEVRARVEEFAAQGVTEIAYQPAGPDIPRELEAFIAAVR